MHVVFGVNDGMVSSNPTLPSAASEPLAKTAADPRRPVRWVPGISPEASQPMSHLALKIPPALVLAVCATAATLLGHGLPWANLPFPGHRWLALATVGIGIVVAMAGVWAFHRARTTVNPLAPQRARAMVTGGIYRVSRNPMYLGMALALAGVALWWASVPALMLVPAFGRYLVRFQIGPEEQALRARFGAALEAYAARARRWV